jgi:hypothetical protein
MKLRPKKARVVILLLLLCGFSMSAALLSTASISADAEQAQNQLAETGDAAQCSVMMPDRATRREWIDLYNRAPSASLDPVITRRLMESPGMSFDLLEHLEYNPIERVQIHCGNCWVWTGTGILEVALSVQDGIKDRLSVQYFASCFNGGVGEDWACCGGWLDGFADFYRANGFVIPWSNENASWQDGTQWCEDFSTSVPCGSIATTCSYPLADCAAPRIETHGVGKEAAIANIKNVLHQNKAVWFAFFFPNATDIGQFRDFWWSESEQSIWDPDYLCGHTWVEAEGAGHAVLCLGYNDTDPQHAYWIMLNSWGTTEGRPNGLFYVDMDMDYDCYYLDEDLDVYNFYWQTLNVTFEIPDGFDTGPGSYPSISGTHNGTITIFQPITVSKLYTYPCAGTGGHAAYMRIFNDTWSVETVQWPGYESDGQYLPFDHSFSLHCGETYKYTIVTGSYPQVIHGREYNATGGRITCSEFRDVNGRTDTECIPAIRLE